MIVIGTIFVVLALAYLAVVVFVCSVYVGFGPFWELSIFGFVFLGIGILALYAARMRDPDSPKPADDSEKSTSHGPDAN